MTRPLTVFLQFLGLVLLVVGYATGDGSTIGWGVALVIAGAVGHRQRARAKN